MPCLEICKGLFFFFYCPLLPLIWILEYLWVFAKHKWRRHKRKKRFRELRAAKQKEKDKTYLQLDKYSRGKIEREILDFSKDLKRKRQEKKRDGLFAISIHDFIIVILLYDVTCRDKRVQSRY